MRKLIGWSKLFLAFESIAAIIIVLIRVVLAPWHVHKIFSAIVTSID